VTREKGPRAALRATPLAAVSATSSPPGSSHRARTLSPVTSDSPDLHVSRRTDQILVGCGNGPSVASSVEMQTAAIQARGTLPGEGSDLFCRSLEAQKQLWEHCCSISSRRTRATPRNRSPDRKANFDRGNALHTVGVVSVPFIMCRLRGTTGGGGVGPPAPPDSSFRICPGDNLWLRDSDGESLQSSWRLDRTQP
jgi:hypothetical protein